MKLNKIYNIKGSHDKSIRFKRTSILLVGTLLVASSIGGVGYLISSLIQQEQDRDIKNQVRHHAYTGNSMLWKNVQRLYDYLIFNKTFYQDGTKTGPHQIGGIYDDASGQNKGAFPWFQDYYAAIFYFIFKDNVIANGTYQQYANNIMNPSDLDVNPYTVSGTKSNSNLLHFFTKMNPDFFQKLQTDFYASGGSSNVTTEYQGSTIKWGQTGSNFTKYYAPIAGVAGYSSNGTGQNNLMPYFQTGNAESLANDSEIVRYICELAMAIMGTTLNLFSDSNLDPDIALIRTIYIQNSDKSSILSPRNTVGTPIPDYNRFKPENNPAITSANYFKENVYSGVSTQGNAVTASILDFFLSPIFMGKNNIFSRLAIYGIGTNNSISSTITGADRDYASRQNKSALGTTAGIDWDKISVFYSPLGLYGGIADDDFIYCIDPTTGIASSTTPHINSTSNSWVKLQDKISQFFGSWDADLIASPTTTAQQFKFSYDFNYSAIWKEGSTYFSSNKGVPYINTTEKSFDGNYWIDDTTSNGTISFYHAGSVGITVSVVEGNKKVHSIKYYVPWAIIGVDANGTTFVMAPTQFNSTKNNKVDNDDRISIMSSYRKMAPDILDLSASSTFSSVLDYASLLLGASIVLDSFDLFASWYGLFNWSV